jgi:hypothetical protein
MFFGCRSVMDFGDFPTMKKHVFFMLDFVSQQTIDKLGFSKMNQIISNNNLIEAIDMLNDVFNATYHICYDQKFD